MLQIGSILVTKKKSTKNKQWRRLKQTNKKVANESWANQQTKPIDSITNLKERTRSHGPKCKIHSINLKKKSALTINSKKQATEQEKKGKGSTRLVN